MNIILPIVILVSWFTLLIILPGKDAQNNGPNEKRRWTSMLPLFPLLPLLAWETAVGVDHFIPPWGSWIFLGIHAVLLLVSLCILTQNFLRLRKNKA